MIIVKSKLDQNIATKYMEFNTLLMNYIQQRANETATSGYPNRGQAKVLDILMRHETMTQKDLIRELQMKPQSASELIHKLEKKAFIRRHKSADDKRVFIIELTDLGRQEAERNHELQPIALHVLTEEEKEQFYHILNKLTHHMQQKENE